MLFVDSIVSVLAPHDCLLCNKTGALVCEPCAADAFLNIPSRCYRCKQQTKNFSVCDSCKKTTSLRHVWVRTDYKDIAQALLHLYKFERAVAAAPTIARALEEVLPYLSKDTLIIPVPTATRRIRQRGYDHVALVAKELARRRSYEFRSCLVHLTSVRQVGASRTQRLRQLQNVLVVSSPVGIRGRSVLLIDDVTTTGASLEVAATVLKKAGAQSVDALAFAQKQ